MPATKNSALSRDILHNKNHLYEIILVQLSQNIVLKHFQAAEYKKFQNLKFSLQHLLTAVLTMVAAVNGHNFMQQ